ncbi:MAG: DUF4192 domain-containing protein [Dermatophilaceae bacterium]|nr:DUF4192 domain-containing protein [Dermatophilaceae bacterium]
MTTTIRLNGPADVLTVLPYQLGFHPCQCLVAVSLRGSRSNRVGLVQRIDLPPSEHVGDAVDAMMVPLFQDAPESVLLIGFEEIEGQSRAMLDEMDDACRAYGIKVADRMVVRDGRWFDLDCVQSCCPPEGLPLPAPSEVPAVAEFVGREICPLPDRSALADLVEPNRPQPGRAISRLAQEWRRLRHEATGTGPAGLPAGQQEPVIAERGPVAAECGPVAAERELHDFRASELAVWSRVLCCEDDAEPIRELPPQDLAMLAASLTDVDLRDGLIAWLCPGTLSLDLIDPFLSAQMTRVLAEPRVRGDLEGAGGMEQVIRLQRLERRLCELSAALPDAWAVPTLTVLASFSWWRGDGALTRIALDRALRVEPEYRLAQLLERMVDLAIRPERASA